jgi:hypothetical protein
MSGTSTPDPVRKLEAELDRTRRHAGQLGKSIHRAMARDLRAAVRRAEAAERAARRAEAAVSKARRRAERAEQELTELRASTTWRAGRAIVAAPAAAKRALRRRSD